MPEILYQLAQEKINANGRDLAETNLTEFTRRPGGICRWWPPISLARRCWFSTIVQRQTLPTVWR